MTTYLELVGLLLIGCLATAVALTIFVCVVYCAIIVVFTLIKQIKISRKDL